MMSAAGTTCANASSSGVILAGSRRLVAVGARSVPRPAPGGAWQGAVRMAGEVDEWLQTGNQTRNGLHGRARRGELRRLWHAQGSHEVRRGPEKHALARDRPRKSPARGSDDRSPRRTAPSHLSALSAAACFRARHRGLWGSGPGSNRPSRVRCAPGCSRRSSSRCGARQRAWRRRGAGAGHCGS